MAILHDNADDEPKAEFGGPFGPGPRETVADLVRRARKDTGQNLRGVADVLRIRLAYLEAIESGDFDRLPGPTYAVGFLRTYSEYLGLDGEEMVERFKAETQAAERHTELIFPEPVTESRIPGGAIIFVSVILLAAAYGGWFYLSQQGRTVADLIPAWPSQTQPETAATPGVEQAPAAAASESPRPETPAPVEAAPQAPEIVATPAAPASPTGTAEEAASATPLAVTPAEQSAPVQEPAPQIAAVAEPAAAPASSGQETPQVAAAIDQSMVIPSPPAAPETVIIPDDRSPRVYGGSNDESRIVIRALQDSWVQVRDPQDAILLTRVLRAGDSYRVPDAPGLILLTGNAGGIELEVDGVRLPPVGPPGSVRRSIALDPAQLLSGTANR